MWYFLYPIWAILNFLFLEEVVVDKIYNKSSKVSYSFTYKKIIPYGESYNNTKIHNKFQNKMHNKNSNKGEIKSSYP